MNTTIHLILTIFACIFFVLAIQSCSTLKGEKWDIHNGKLTLNKKGDDKTAKTYWAYVSKVLPNDLLFKYVVSFKLFSDGKDEELGGVTAMNKWNTKWELDIDTIDFDLLSTDSVIIIDYSHTLIHEFGHLLTLNPTQIIRTKHRRQRDELGYLTEEGYATDTSYLGQFVKQFWQEPLLSEWDDIQRIIIGNKRLDALYDFYLNHKKQFLSDYAAESPEEDIAESWTFFVMADKPKVVDVKYQKILFFYNFPELVDYRAQIRNQLQIIPTSYDTLSLVLSREGIK